MNKLYYDPSNPASFGGKQRLVKLAGKDAATWLENQTSYSLHRPARRRFPTRPTLASHPFYQWQADLVDMQSYPDRGYKYILMVIDVFSRFGWSAPLKSKSAEEVTNAFRKIVKQAGRAPEKLQSDKGREFYNKTFQDFLKTQKIQLFSVTSLVKASLVERWNRSLKSRMFRYFTYSKSTKWVQVLPKLVEAYNNAKHRVIGMTPNDALLPRNESLVRERQEKRVQTIAVEPKIKVGDHVRLSTAKGVFEKGYLANWTEEIFRVKAVDRCKPPMFTVEDAKQQEIQGRFYIQELQKVKNI